MTIRKLPFPPKPMLTINADQIEFPTENGRASLSLKPVELVFELTAFSHHVIIAPSHAPAQVLSAKAATPHRLMHFERSEDDHSKGFESDASGRSVRFVRGAQDAVKITSNDEFLIEWTMNERVFAALMAEFEAEGVLNASLTVAFDTYSDIAFAPARLTVMDEVDFIRDGTVIRFEIKRTRHPANV